MGKAGPGETEVPAEIKKFILENIRSVAALELLLFLFERRPQAFTFEQLVQELRSNISLVTALVQNLEAKKWIQSDEVNGQSLVKLAELDSINLKLFRLLLESFSKKRMTLIDLIYMSPLEKLRQFSAAFKIRK